MLKIKIKCPSFDLLRIYFQITEKLISRHSIFLESNFITEKSWKTKLSFLLTSNTKFGAKKSAESSVSPHCRTVSLIKQSHVELWFHSDMFGKESSSL